MAAVIGVRGGAGATTVATSLAWLMGEKLRRSTALLDLDVHFGTGALSLDLEPGRGLTDAIENPSRIDGLFIERAMVKASEKLAVLSAEAPINQPMLTDGSAILPAAGRNAERVRVHRHRPAAGNACAASASDGGRPRDGRRHRNDAGFGTRCDPHPVLVEKQRATVEDRARRQPRRRRRDRDQPQGFRIFDRTQDRFRHSGRRQGRHAGSQARQNDCRCWQGEQARQRADRYCQSSGSDGRGKRRPTPRQRPRRTRGRCSASSAG